MSNISEKNEASFGEGASFNPNDQIDAEGQRRRSSTMVHGRRMSRIGPPPKSLSVSNGSGEEDYTKLIAMEADNAIKYRTCSWQKVSDTFRLEYYLDANETNRLRLCSSLSISAWQSCHSLIHIQSLDWYPA